jgi:signal transduction histidine kinase
LNRLRNRLILVFLAATLLPLAATVWITTTILDRSKDFSTVGGLEMLSDSLESLGRQYFQQQQENLKQRAEAGALKPQKVAADRLRENESQRFVLSGDQGDRLEYLVRHGNEVWSYSSDLHVPMRGLEAQIRAARGRVEDARGYDLRRAYIVLVSVLWLTALALLIYMAHRVSRPIQQLTAGLGAVSGGNLAARVDVDRDDEIGRAIAAFNRMAEKLQETTERLVYLRQLESWQLLARKTAHEVKNSLTPIRLTVEEMLVRYDDHDRPFMEQATQIVVEEIEALERRVRAFSQFAAEPPVRLVETDVNALLTERIAFLKAAHPEVTYECNLADSAPPAIADHDLVKGILTNLLENAAEAAGAGGRILSRTAAENGNVTVEVHDSGPGLSEQARSSLFQPTITFKKRGMGLGLSIARKSALLSGGDIVLVKGELGGAGFRVLLPIATNGLQTLTDRG